MADKNIIKVKIFGSEYTLKTDADENYVKEISEHINKVMAGVAAKNSNLPALKISVLSLIEIVDELLRIKSQVSELDSEMGDKTSELIERIEEQLSRSYSLVE
jgi:cell division protein ZapA